MGAGDLPADVHFRSTSRVSEAGLPCGCSASVECLIVVPRVVIRCQLPGALLCFAGLLVGAVPSALAGSGGGDSTPAGIIAYLLSMLGASGVDIIQQRI